MLEPEKHVPEAVPGLNGLDLLLQHRSRLGACVLLSTSDALTFSRLKTLLGETDGNLGAQLRKLEDAGYVHVRKVFEQRKPVSWYALTPAGSKALRTHLAAMEEIVRRSAGSAEKPKDIHTPTRKEQA